MEESKNNEGKVLNFKDWQETNKWFFNEQLELYANTEKKELKTNDELLEIYSKEVKEIESKEKSENEKKQKAKEVQQAFQNFLDKNKWSTTGEEGIFQNDKGEKKSINELVEDFKNEINGNKKVIKEENKKEEKQVKEKNTTKVEDNFPEVGRVEGEAKLKGHKYKGDVQKYDYNPKEGTMWKKVILFGKDEKELERFKFQTVYEVN